MSIMNALRSRATVHRAQRIAVDGSPVRTWEKIAVDVPVAFSRTDSLADPTWTADQRREAEQEGTLYTLPRAGLLPGDRVTITRPDIGTFELQSDVSLQSTLDQAHHREFRVTSV